MENGVKIESVKSQDIDCLRLVRMTLATSRERSSRTVTELDTDVVDTPNLDKIREDNRTRIIRPEDGSNEETTKLEINHNLEIMLS